ncbi:hypothetical protein RRF57_002627 [Xylaria bambusicola]|uniref:Uncharacterized protein n=1 Tax=Xylaria bambusicola TaxID=326684 RepID=A0AAN7Z1Z5_9PEZI
MADFDDHALPRIPSRPQVEQLLGQKRTVAWDIALVYACGPNIDTVSCGPLPPCAALEPQGLNMVRQSAAERKKEKLPVEDENRSTELTGSFAALGSISFYGTPRSAAACLTAHATWYR